MSTLKEKLSTLKNKMGASFKKLTDNSGLIRVGDATYALQFDNNGKVTSCDCIIDRGYLPKTKEEQAERKAAVMAKLNAKGYNYSQESINIK